MARLEPRDTRRDTDRLWAALVAVATLAFAASPLVSDGFNGFTPGQFPVPQTDPPVQPAGYAFAIWGLIYVWLIAGAGFGLLRRDTDAGWRAMRPPLVCQPGGRRRLDPGGQSRPWAATVLIWVMLLSALLALSRTPPVEGRWLLRAPISLYAGWLTAASWVAVALLGAGYGVGFAQTGWAWVGLAGALATALAVTRLVAAAPFYAAGVAWALIAVAVANWGANWGLVAASLGGAAVVAVPALGRLRAG